MAFAAAPPKKGQDDSTPIFPRHSMAAFLLVTGLFFLWGIPNNLNDVLIRQFMKSFDISRLQAGLVQSAFYTGYFCFSVPAALIMRRFVNTRNLSSIRAMYALVPVLFPIT